MLDEYFPYIVCESLFREFIVFKFHVTGEPLCEFNERISHATTFLRYQASEQQLVDRILMNLDPVILSHAAFLDRPRCIKDLYRVVCLIEEKISVSRERLRADPDPKRERGGRGKPRDEHRAVRQKQKRAGAGAIKCWGAARRDTTVGVVLREIRGHETGGSPLGV